MNGDQKKLIVTAAATVALASAGAALEGDKVLNAAMFGLPGAVFAAGALGIVCAKKDND